MLTLILGGARSGKSRYAQDLAASYEEVLYVATAIPFDEGMKERIRHHQNSRPATWKTLEKWRDFSGEAMAECVLVDCVTLMVSNLLITEEERVGLAPELLPEIEGRIWHQIDQLLDWIGSREGIMVSNEVGLGLASPYELGNAFRDISGRINQYLAMRADRVVMMVSGLPLSLKEKS